MTLTTYLDKTDPADQEYRHLVDMDHIHPPDTCMDPEVRPAAETQPSPATESCASGTSPVGFS